MQVDIKNVVVVVQYDDSESSAPPRPKIVEVPTACSKLGIAEMYAIEVYQDYTIESELEENEIGATAVLVIQGAEKRSDIIFAVGDDQLITAFRANIKTLWSEWCFEQNDK